MLKAALNGDREQGIHPALPLGAGELAADAAACVRAGAAAIHIHPRDDDGWETLAADVVDQTVRAVRLAAGVAVGVSTGAWIEPDPRRRADLVSAWREPDMASVNLSEDGAETVMQALLDAGIGIEAGIWSVDDAERLAASGFATRVVRVLVEIVHPVQDPAAEAMTIDERLDHLGIAAPRLHHGEEDATWPVLRQAATLGRDIRIGLEDPLFFPTAPSRRPMRHWSWPLVLLPWPRGRARQETRTRGRTIVTENRSQSLARLGVFVGEWIVEVRFPGDEPVPSIAKEGPQARSRFEWALDRQFLLQRTEVPVPEVPDSLSIISVNPATGAYTQHYYDSRGVVRLYAMSLADGVWTLTRESGDFSPLDFRQRFTGTFSPDGNTISGAWEKCFNGAGWEHDFALTYRRTG